MRFKQFLSESSNSFSLEEAIAKIKKECGPFLLQSGGLPLFRGVRNKAEANTWHPHPTDREPKDSGNSPGFNFMFNAMIDAAFDISDIRRKTLFATGSEHDVKQYGTTYFCFPCGDIDFVWSPSITDSYVGKWDILRKLLSTFKNADVLTAEVLKKFFAELSDITENDPHTWVNNIAGNSEEQFMRAMSDVLGIDDYEGTTYKGFIEVLKNTAKELYLQSDLHDAIINEHEILFYKTSGYYLISIEEVYNEMGGRGMWRDGAGNYYQKNYDFLLDEISGS